MKVPTMKEAHSRKRGARKMYEATQAERKRLIEKLRGRCSTMTVQEAADLIGRSPQRCRDYARELGETFAKASQESPVVTRWRGKLHTVTCLELMRQENMTEKAARSMARRLREKFKPAPLPNQMLPKDQRRVYCYASDTLHVQSEPEAAMMLEWVRKPMGPSDWFAPRYSNVSPYDELI